MRTFVAFLLLSLTACVSVGGIVGITSSGCFPKYQNAWWILGVSSLLGTCCIIAITISTFRFPSKQRRLIWLVACGMVSALILCGIWFSSWFPRIGPPRRGDLLQLASLIPLLTISLAFTPMLIRIYRGISLLRTVGSSRQPEKRAAEYFQFATLFGVAFVLPFVANVAIEHTSADPGFFVLFSIACIFFGLFIVYPFTLALMKLNWIGFFLASVSLLLVASFTIAFAIAGNGLALTAREISITTAAILSGPAMLILFCLALRLQKFRISIPPRSFNVSNTQTDLGIHPLDA